MKVLEHSGHFAWVEEPDRFFAEVVVLVTSHGRCYGEPLDALLASSVSIPVAGAIGQLLDDSSPAQRENVQVRKWPWVA